MTILTAGREDVFIDHIGPPPHPRSCSEPLAGGTLEWVRCVREPEVLTYSCGSCQVTDAGTFAHMVSGRLARHRTHMLKPFLPRSIETGSGSCVFFSILHLFSTARHRADFGARVHHMLVVGLHNNAANLRQLFACSSSILEVLFGRGRRPALRLSETPIFSILFAASEVLCCLAGIF